MTRPTAKRGNMSKFPLRMQAEMNREEICRIIDTYPGIIMQDIARAMGQSKSTVYQSVAVLISLGRVTPVALGTKGWLGYYIVTDMSAVNPKLEEPGRFDYPTQTIVAAKDGAKLPPMDELTACLFGRNKETA